MYPLSKWHALWLGVAVLVCILAVAARLHRDSARPTGPVTVTTATGPAGPPVARLAGPPAPLAPARSEGMPSGPIYVHVSGQVARPGLYRLAVSARVMDAITGAGGATADANLDALNLATPLHDGQKLFVPRYGEPPPSETEAYLVDSPPPPEATLVVADPSPVPRWPGAPSDAPSIVESSAPLITPAPSGSSQGFGGPPAQPRESGRSASAKLRTPGEGYVNINRAASVELQRLPGVGPSTAAKILDYRSAHGGFRSIEELMEVKGIGPKKLEKMAPFVVLQ